MLRRREVLVATGAAASLSLAGCLGGGTDSVAVRTPDGSGSASPGELRWLLTNGKKRLTVTGMRFDGERLAVTFASAASNLTEFVDEVAVVLDEYARYVENDGPGSRLTAHVADRETTDYAGNGDRGQAASFYVEREWAADFNAGALSRRKYLQKALRTRSWGDANA